MLYFGRNTNRANRYVLNHKANRIRQPTFCFSDFFGSGFGSSLAATYLIWLAGKVLTCHFTEEMWAAGKAQGQDSRHLLHKNSIHSGSSK